VLPERIYTQGFGFSQPIADNDTPEGRALNRRVEIHLNPLT
jgi:outer membrane protein OmpA-like peptidoglycan-associated protein